jgi:nucleoside 2-deoxyribosyltransferase
MVDNIPKVLNVFISRANKDEKQQEIYSELCEEYRENVNICIIDVDNIYEGLNNNLCEGILQEINKCDLFICILTPIHTDESGKYINNNVLLELGYAYSCINKENIYIFIEDDEQKKKDFEKLRPSMLFSFKYKTYITYEDIDNVINQKYNDVEYSYNNNFNKYVLLDKNVVSIIKYEITKILNDDVINIKNKMNKIGYYIQNYKCCDVIEVIFLFIDEYINIHQLEYYLLDWFFNCLSNVILDFDFVWINVKNNQIKLLNLLKLIQYKLFEKFRNINKIKINKNRRNFAITLYELLKTKNFYYRNEVMELLDVSIKNNIHGKYELFTYKLKLLHNCNNINKKNYYEDLITNSKNSYNTYHICEP